MRACLVAALIFAGLVSCADGADCGSFGPAVRRLQSYLSFENARLGADATQERFAVVGVQGRVLFRQDRPWPGDDPNNRRVYVYSGAGALAVRG